jgi:hypothetical protein
MGQVEVDDVGGKGSGNNSNVSIVKNVEREGATSLAVFQLDSASDVVVNFWRATAMF